jgi:hypothetical protein
LQPEEAQDCLFCSRVQRSQSARTGEQNGGYLKSPADNAWQAAVSAA